MAQTILLWLCAVFFGFLAIVASATASDDEREGRRRRAAGTYWLALISMVIALACAAAA